MRLTGMDDNHNTNSNVGAPAKRRSPNDVKQWDGSSRSELAGEREAVRAEWEESGFASNGKGAVPFTPWPSISASA